MFEDRIQIRVYKINREKVANSNLFISVKDKKILITFQAQFGGKAKKIEA